MAARTPASSRGAAARGARRLATGVLCVAAGLLVAAGPAGRCALERAVYGLTVDSHFEEGCFPPLQCPSVILPLGGTFRLTRLPGAEPEVEQFLVSDLFWLVRLGGEDVRIRGFGRLTRFSEFEVLQRLELFLRIGEREIEAFDSGFTVAETPFPDLDLTVSKNGGMFFDTVIRLDAVPFPRDRVSEDNAG